MTSPRVRARSPLPLNTGRLQLHPMGAAHADLLARQERESGWAPDYPQPTDLDAARHLFESGLLYDDGRFGVWLIIELAGGAVIGTIGFDGPPQDGVLQIFYGIVPSRRGFGMAYEALHCLTAYAAAGSEVNSIEAYAQSDASAAVLRKAGYGRAGGSADTRSDALFIWEAGPLERPSSQASPYSPPAAS